MQFEGKENKKNKRKSQQEDISTNRDQNKDLDESIIDDENYKEIAGNGDKFDEEISKNPHLIDHGGALLHKVFWFGKTFGNIIRAYWFFVKMGFVVCTVGFDGYGKSSTKDHEHARRMQKQQSSSDVNVKEEVTVHHTREEFLCNTRNKAQLIKVLSHYFKEGGHIVINCKDDADTQIVEAALDFACGVMLLYLQKTQIYLYYIWTFGTVTWEDVS